MKITIDIDGTISELKKSGQTYSTVRPNTGAIEKIKALKAAGHYIILQTARHMKTTGGNQGQILAKVGKTTLDWLAEYDIPYDEIYFGKPYTDIYLDDRAHQFTDWHSITTTDFDDQKLNILIPMAGAGSRFTKAGFTVPKPLIITHGKTLIEWAMQSFDFLIGQPNVQLIFIILEEHEVAYELTASLKKIFGETITVIVSKTVTRGQAETCLLATTAINNYNQLVIYNCDTYTTGNQKMLDLIAAERPDGILACFESADPRYSYARLDEYGYVDLTAEKTVVSNQASSGLYYFRRGSDFVTAANSMIHDAATAGGEYYVAPCYNYLLRSGKKVKTYTVDANWVLGTPEELTVFNTTYAPL